MSDQADEVAANLHGTAVAVGGAAVLIRGPSGAGKSDLALRMLALRPGPLVAHQPLLVADDRVIAAPRSAGVIVSCPDVLQGLLEVRGLGIVRVEAAPATLLALVVDLVPPSAIERLPEGGRAALICGRSIPCIEVSPFEGSAPLKVMLALQNLA